jgi:hypothetical protein
MGCAWVVWIQLTSWGCCVCLVGCLIYWLFTSLVIPLNLSGVTPLRFQFPQPLAHCQVPSTKAFPNITSYTSLELSVTAVHLLELSVTAVHLLELSVTAVHLLELSVTAVHLLELSLTAVHLLELSVTAVHLLELSLTAVHLLVCILNDCLTNTPNKFAENVALASHGTYSTVPEEN